MKPRIAIPVPTSRDIAYNQRSWSSYADAVSAAGGDPVSFALGQGSAPALTLARGCHGVCLPGSPADVDPDRYGAERDPATAPVDAAREALDLLLLEEAAASGKPVLAICFGMQMMNVWRGGSLVQDVTPIPVNHAAGSKVAVAHAAMIAPQSRLASLLSAEEAPLMDGFLRLPMNSSHHQAVSAPGEGLRVVARCPDDGVIEAVEADTDALDASAPFLLGVQWHPERSYQQSAASRSLFSALIAAATSFAAGQL